MIPAKIDPREDLMIPAKIDPREDLMIPAKIDPREFTADLGGGHLIGGAISPCQQLTPLCV